MRRDKQHLPYHWVESSHRRWPSRRVQSPQSQWPTFAGQWRCWAYCNPTVSPLAHYHYHYHHRPNSAAERPSSSTGLSCGAAPPSSGAAHRRRPSCCHCWCCCWCHRHCPPVCWCGRWWWPRLIHCCRLRCLRRRHCPPQRRSSVRWGQGSWDRSEWVPCPRQRWSSAGAFVWQRCRRDRSPRPPAASPECPSVSTVRMPKGDKGRKEQINNWRSPSSISSANVAAADSKFTD